MECKYVKVYVNKWVIIYIYSICGIVEFMSGNFKIFVCNFRLYSGLIIMNRMKL